MTFMSLLQTFSFLLFRLFSRRMTNDQKTLPTNEQKILRTIHRGAGIFVEDVGCFLVILTLILHGQKNYSWMILHLNLLMLHLGFLRLNFGKFTAIRSFPSGLISSSCWYWIPSCNLQTSHHPRMSPVSEAADFCLFGSQFILF